MPIKNLSKFAKVLLWIILSIGVIVLIVINIFNIRERKYEIGVLTAIGVRKSKVVSQFIIELLCIAIIAIILGGAAGSVSSIPISNALLKSQVESVEKENSAQTENFGSNENSVTPRIGQRNANLFNEGQSYIEKINARINITVFLQLVLIGILITVVASFFAVLSIVRYDPIKILANST